MPKLRNKRKALEILIHLGDALSRLCDERGVEELTVGRGELKHMLNRGVRRGKDLLTMALQRFVVAESISTTAWEIQVKDREKPVIRFRRHRR